uniref:Cytochrome c biogenesis protein Ccs1 n=1 Tax=Laurenciella marilzae TaxID=1413812 RepID=A0A1Z1M0T4_9FLOR|nr:cytochrome c biogenesis protein ccs1 [Laurenciella marilzae]ARW59718.1 cytochrome c biogenesis protein ccs1 [Laurenciella marilzae]
MINFVFKNFLWNSLKRLANLNLSIFILFLISLCCVLGSLIEQDQSLVYYQSNYPVSNLSFSIVNWQIIYNLGLDHVFQTWWFIVILIVFILTLLSCTFFTQLPSLRNARRWKFIYNKDYFNNSFFSKENYISDDNSLIAMIYSLVSSDFFVFSQDYSIYSYRGLYGRMSPIFVHFSIVSILLGSMFSFLSSFVAQEMVPNGEIFHIRNIIHSGLLSSLPPNIFGRVETFNIDYNDNGSIRQFFSKLSIMSSQGQIIVSQQISVNKPLIYRYLTFYQTDWELNSVKISLANDGVLQKKLFKTIINNKNSWLCKIAVDDYKQVILAVFDLNSPIFLFSSEGILMSKLSINQLFYINDLPFVVNDILASTGLQIKMDFGILIVYLGFLVLILSTILSYLSYSQIWFYRVSNVFYFLASTNRAVLSFEEDTFAINCSYYSLTSGLNLNIGNNFVNSYVLK